MFSLNIRPYARRRFGVLSLAATAVLVLGSCGSTTSSNNAGSGAPPAYGLADSSGTSAQGVTYTSKTVRVDRATVASQLKSVSSDGTTFTFASKSGAIGNLQAGSVMFLEGTAVRNVTSVSSTGGTFVVKTSPAALTDLISDGTVTWNTPVDYNSGFIAQGDEPNDDDAASAQPAQSPSDDGSDDTASPSPVDDGSGDGSGSDDGTGGDDGSGGDLNDINNALSSNRIFSRNMASAGEPLMSGGGSVKGKLGDYGFKVSYTPQGNDIAVSAELSRDSPINLSVSATGTVSKFTSKGSFAISGGAMQQATMAASGLKADFKLEYTVKAVSGLGAGGQEVLRIPLSYRIPIIVGGIPFYVGLKAAFFVAIGFSQKDEQVSGSYTISYDGDSGFTTASDGATTPQGVMDAVGQIVLDAQNATMNGPIGIVIGGEVPRIDVGLGIWGAEVGAYVDIIGTTAIKVGGGGGGGGLIGIGGGSTGGCDARSLEVVGKAGVYANLFGLTFSPSSATLFDKRVDASLPDGCGAIG